MIKAIVGTVSQIQERRHNGIQDIQLKLKKKNPKHSTLIKPNQHCTSAVYSIRVSSPNRSIFSRLSTRPAIATRTEEAQ